MPDALAIRPCAFIGLMQTYLDIQHLTKSVGDRLLFADISMSIAEGQHVGLIAKNGTGKSTLLDIICGKTDYDSGSVTFRKGLRLGYLEQTPRYVPHMTVLDACFAQAGELSNLISRYEKCLMQPGQPGLAELSDEMERRGGWDFEVRAKQVLTKLSITEYDKPVGQLSGGQLKRVALANVLLTEPDMLILDEPTNHLDLDMIEWLEGHLKRRKCALLMVTHDRYFLDRVCSQILELDRQTLYTYRGNYSYYLEKRAERIAAADAAAMRTQNLYRRELEWIRRTPSARGTKARYRKDAFIELQEQAKLRPEEKTARLEVKSGYIGSKIFEAQYVSKAFGTEEKITILDKFYYNFSRYEKMGIVGGNGTGKTTFLRLLLGLERPDEGRFVVGETVNFGYFAQEEMPFDERLKVIEAVREHAEEIDLGGGRRLSAMQFLTHFLFPPERQQDYVYKLSGGERRRLQLCIVLMRNPNFLILDEPTNDLDIPTLQVLEEYLQTFRGCVIIVSHDRYFMDKVVDHLLVFRGAGRIDDFPGNYTQYREEAALTQDSGAENVSVSASKPTRTAGQAMAGSPSTNRHRSGNRLSYKEKREMEQLEKDIAALEAEKQHLEAELCSGTLDVADLTEKSRRLPVLAEELSEKEMRWLELSEIEHP